MVNYFIVHCLNFNNYVYNRVWFLRPLRDQSVLKQRHDAVSFFITPRNIEIVSALSDNLKNVKDIQVITYYIISKKGIH